MQIKKPIIVVSAINIHEGGPLIVVKECLRNLNTYFSDHYQIIAYIHKTELYKQADFDNVTFEELPKSRKSWLYRVYYEYFHFRKISKKLKPYLWLSLHDMTPFLRNTEKQCVYCHNPSMFYKPSLKELYYDKTHVLFSLFYKFLFGINIKSNYYTIVQQDWIRSKFNEYFHVPLSSILVSYPEVAEEPSIIQTFHVSARSEHKPVTFIYGAYPRIYKNHEVIVKASKILVRQGITNFKVNLTMSGEENNAYSKKIKSLSESTNQITFLGLGGAPREVLLKEYDNADILIFPSKLETWGLPITEFKNYQKPILAADLEYAHETVGNYDKVAFFSPDEAQDLANKMKLIIQGNGDQVWKNAVIREPAHPFTQSWKEMLQLILAN